MFSSMLDEICRGCVSDDTVQPHQDNTGLSCGNGRSKRLLVVCMVYNHADVTPVMEEIVRCVPCQWNLTDICSLTS